MNIFGRQPKIERNSIDDVLELSTEENLEHHTNKAAAIAEDMLVDAAIQEDKDVESVKKAKELLELSTAKRINKENLVNSIASVFRKLRK